MHLHPESHEVTLGLSFLLGALHALEPGHGKTAMLVYLMGGRRSLWHPVVMGLATALSHSASLFAIAFAVHLTHHLVTVDHHHEEQVSGALKGLSALLVVGVGVWMVKDAWTGRCACCHHHRDDAASELQLVELNVAPADVIEPLPVLTSAVAESRPGFPGEPSLPEKPKSSFRTTAILGLAVGLLPCPTALAAYFSSLSTGAPGTAYFIIAVFAAGIASSLSITGILLQAFGERLSRRASRVRTLPWGWVRAVLILGLGIYYCGTVFVTG